MEKKKKEISVDEWNENELVNGKIGCRDIHIKEIDDKLGMNYEYSTVTTKKGRKIYILRNINVSSSIFLTLFLVGITVACLSNFFMGQIKDIPNFILLVIITILLLLGDIWSIYELIHAIKVKNKNKKNTQKKSLLSKIFSILYTFIIILFILAFGFVIFMILTPNLKIPKKLGINIEHWIIIYFAILLILFILAFIIQIILAIQGWNEHNKKNK